MADDEKNLTEQARDAVLRKIAELVPRMNNHSAIRELAEAYALVTGGKEPTARD